MSYKHMTRFRPINCFLLSCFYERQADKPAQPISWLGSCERKYCLLCREKVSWKNFEPLWRNITSMIVMSWKLLPKFRQITWFFHLCFYGCQADKPAREIGFLDSCEWKYCHLGAGKVLWKNIEPFWRNVTSKIVFSCMFLSIYCYNRLFAVTDVSMNANRTTSAANWLTRFKWREILSTLGRECIVQKFRAVFEKYII